MRKMKCHQDILFHALKMVGYQTVSLRDMVFPIQDAVDNPEIYNSLSFIVNNYSALSVHGATFLFKFYKPSNYIGTIEDLELHPTEDSDLFPPLHNTIGLQLAYALHVVGDVADKLAARNNDSLSADTFVEILSEIVDITPAGGYLEMQPIIASLMEQKIMDVVNVKIKATQPEVPVALLELEDTSDNLELTKEVSPEVFNEFITPSDDGDLNFLS